MVFETFQSYEIILFFVIGALFFGIGGWAMFYIYGKKRWPLMVSVVEETPPYGWVPGKQYKARFVSFGDDGSEILYLKGINKYRIAYGKKIGPGKYLFAISAKDGYWYNCTMGDLDKTLMQIGLRPISRDARMGVANVRKQVERRYDDKTFFEKWGVPITMGMLIIAIIVMGGAMWYNMDKQVEISQSINEGLRAIKDAQETTKQVLAQVSSILQGGSGIRPA